MRELNRELFAATAAWLEPHVEAGAHPPAAARPDLRGPDRPGQEFSRHWLERRMRTSIAKAERALPEAAWNALRARESEGPR